MGGEGGNGGGRTGFQPGRRKGWEIFRRFVMGVGAERVYIFLISAARRKNLARVATVRKSPGSIERADQIGQIQKVP